MPESPARIIAGTLTTLASDRGAAAAVRIKNRSLSFSKIAEELDRLGQALGKAAPGRALILLPDGIASYLAHLYLFLERGTAVPISPVTPAHQLSVTASLVKPDLVITSLLLLQKYSISDLACPVLVADEAPGDEAELTWKWAGKPLDGDVCASDPVRVILFTSGSTGSPKGVCLGEQSLVSAAQMNISLLSLNPARRSVSTVPLFDYYGLIQIYSHLLAGAELVLGASVAFPRQVLSQIEAVNATDLVGVPYGLRRVAGVAEATRSDALAGLEFITSSSETLGTDVQGTLLRLCRDVTIVDVYGLTEAGRACSRMLREVSKGSEFVGRPSPGVTISAGSAEQRGELVVRGPNVMLGYMSGITACGQVGYRRCEEVRTGDEGYVDAAGNIHILGRRDDLLNVRGDKIHPAEIESVAVGTGAITDARVRLQQGLEPELVLEVVSTEPASDFSALHRRLRERLPLQFVPRRIVQVDEIARTEVGLKTIRR